MKYLPWAVFVLLSCNNSPGLMPPQKERDLRTFFSEKAKQDFPNSNLDSFRIVRIDTLVEWMKFSERRDECIDQFNAKKTQCEELMEIARGAAESYMRAKRFGDNVRYYRDIAQDKQDKLEKGIEELNGIRIACDTLLQQMKRGDSLIPVNYHAITFYQIRRPDKAIMRDSGYVLLTLGHDVISREEWLKY